MSGPYAEGSPAPLSAPSGAGPGAVARFFTGGGLPSFVLALAAVYETFLILLLFGPEGDGRWAAFVSEFKVRCFDYNPATGGMTWAAAWIMLAEPVFIVGLVFALWRAGTRARLARALRGGPLLAGALTGLSAVGAVFAYGLGSLTPPADPLAFPGARIRTALPLPEFQLQDQTGARVDHTALRGRVTLITGVYALCSAACPNILMEVRELLSDLPPEARDHFGVLAFSLDPDRDTLPLMGAIATAYGFTHPRFRYLNGEPEAVRAVTSALQFSAQRDARTGEVDHASLFILVDASGRIAYRFTAEAGRRSWVRQAIAELGREAAAAPSAAGVP
jgi:protein SCO1/2